MLLDDLFYPHSVPLEHNILLYIYLPFPPNMANTFTQLHIQFIFAVKYRLALIHKEWKDELHTLTSATLRSQDKLLRLFNRKAKDEHITPFRQALRRKEV